jgi:predicted alpha/beta-hydrolase family hydrolase
MSPLLTRAARAWIRQFMEFFARGLGEQGVGAVRFEYPYMAVRRRTGQKNPPDREPVLRDTWLKVVEGGWGVRGWSSAASRWEVGLPALSQRRQV